MTTSYANAGGTGNRTALIDTSYSGVTAGCSGSSSDLKALIDGNFTGASCATSFAWGSNTAVVLKFDFRAGNSMIIDEITWYQDTSASQGTWIFYGSNDDITYTNLTGARTLGGATTSTISFSNAVGYRYYKLAQWGGTTDNVTWLKEIEFKIANAAALSYDNTGGRGNRSAVITGASSGLSGGCGSNYCAPLFDGSFVNGCTTAAAWDATGTVATLTFDFGVGNQWVIDEFLWYQDSNATHGTWKFSGSNDNITYTDLQTGITLGVTNSYGQAVFPVANTAAYRYYKLIQTGGTTASTSWNREIEFRIGTASNTWASVEATDIFAAAGYSGLPGSWGSLTTTETADVFAATGYTSVLGTLTVTETPDSFSAYGTLPVTGTMTVTERPDIFAAAGLGLGRDGTWATTEAPDHFAAVGFQPVSGTFIVTEAADRFQALGSGVTRVRHRRPFFVT